MYPASAAINMNNNINNNNTNNVGELNSAASSLEALSAVGSISQDANAVKLDSHNSSNNDRNNNHIPVISASVPIVSNMQQRSNSMHRNSNNNNVVASSVGSSSYYNAILGDGNNNNNANSMAIDTFSSSPDNNHSNIVHNNIITLGTSPRSSNAITTPIKNSPYLLQRKQTINSQLHYNNNYIRHSNDEGEQLNYKLIQSNTLAQIIYQPYKARKLLLFHACALIFFTIPPIIIYLVGRYSYNYTVQLMKINDETSPIGLQIYWSCYLILYTLYMFGTMYQAIYRRQMFPFKARPFLLLVISACSGLCFMVWSLYRVIFNENFHCTFSRLIIDIFIPGLTFPYIIRAVQLSLLFSNYTINHNRTLILFMLSLLPWIGLALFTTIKSEYSDIDEFGCNNGYEYINQQNTVIYQSDRSSMFLAITDGIELLCFIIALLATRNVWDQFQIKSELFIAFITQTLFLVINIIASVDDSIESITQHIVIPLVIIRSVLLFYISFSLPLYQSYALVQHNNNNPNNNDNNNNIISSTINDTSLPHSPSYLHSLLSSADTANTPLPNNNSSIPKLKTDKSKINFNNNNNTITNSEAGNPTDPYNSSGYTLRSVISNLSYFDYFKDYMCSVDTPYSSLWEFYISCVLYADTEHILDRISLGRYILTEFFNQQSFTGKSEFSQWFFLILYKVYNTQQQASQVNSINSVSGINNNPNNIGGSITNSMNGLQRIQSILSSNMNMNLDDDDILRLCESDLNNLMRIFYSDNNVDEIEIDNSLFIRWQEASVEVMNEWCWKGFIHSKYYKNMINEIYKEQQIKQRLQQASII